MSLSRLHKAAQREREERERKEQVAQGRAITPDSGDSWRNQTRTATDPGFSRLRQAAEKEREENPGRYKRSEPSVFAYRQPANKKEDKAPVVSNTSKYLDAARNAKTPSITTEASKMSSEDKEARRNELKAELEELTRQSNLNKTKQTGYSRGNVTSLLRESAAEGEKINARIREINEEMKRLDQPGIISYSDQLSGDLGAALERQKKARNAVAQFSGEAGGRALAVIPKEQRDALYKELNEANAAVEALKRESGQIEYLNKYQDKTYEDTFTGQFGANYNQGRIAQDANAAFSKYLSDPTEANKDYAFALQELEQRFQSNNQSALDDEGTVLPWVTQSAAGYIPQFVDNTTAWAGGALAGGAVGSLVGNPMLGARLGSSAATAAQSYSQMQGAAFRTMLAAGMDEDAAREAAQDEGFVSAVIEFGLNYITWGLTGAGDLIGAAGNAAMKNGSKNAAVKFIASQFGKSAADKMAEQAAKSAGKSVGRQVLEGIGGVALDSAGEYLEEAAQQAVSIANQRRDGTGAWDLTKEAGSVAWDAVTGKDEQARAEMHEAGKEGFKIGMMFGGVTAVTNRVASSYINAKTDEERKAVIKTVLEDKESLDALIQEGKETGNEAAKIAGEIEGKSLRNEEITEKDVARLIAANDVYIEAEIKKAAQEATRTPQDSSTASGGPTVAQSRKSAVDAVSEATGYGEHGTNSFVNIVETTGADPGKVRMEFQSAYESGRVGLPQSVARLDSSVRQEAYNAGRLDAIMAMNTAKEKSGSAVIRKDAGFDRTHLPADVSEAQYKAVDMLAKATGVRVRMAKGLKGNAQIAEDGTVLIDETFQREVAGEKRSIVFYAAHEIGMHRLMQLAPEEGEAFINAVIQDANTGLMDSDITITEQKRAQYAAQNVSLDTGKAMEEVAADSILSLYDNEAAFYEAIDRIVNGKDEKAKQGAKKFKDILDDIVRKLKQVIAKLTGKEKVEAKQTLAEVAQLRDLFEKGLAAATERVKTENATNKPGRAAESRGKIDTQYSAKESVDYAGRKNDKADYRNAEAVRMDHNARGRSGFKGTSLVRSISLSDTQRREIRELISEALDDTAEGRAKVKTADGLNQTVEDILSVVLRFGEFDQIMTEAYPGLTLADIDNIRKIAKPSKKLLAKAELTAQDREYFAALKSDKDKAERMVQAAAARAGYTLRQFHFTDKDFTVFRFGEMGFHVGTLAQAEYRRDGRDGKILNLYIKADNPLSWMDVGRWSAKEIAATMDPDDAFDDFVNAEEIRENVRKIAEISNEEKANAKLREYLNTLGYDSIKYENTQDRDYGDPIDESYLLFDPEQLKSADVVTYDDNGKPIPLSQRFDAEQEDIRFSLKSPVEQTKNLIALHNLTDEKLRKALALGGFPMPSIAVTRADIPHTNFGDITLVMNKSTIDPKASRKNTVYSADAWTPVFPKVEYEVDSRIAHEFYDKARKAEGRIPAEYVSKANMLASSIDSYLNTYETEEGVVERFKDEYAIKALYLAEQGERVETKTRENRTEKAKSPMLDAVLDVFDEDVETLRNIPLGELHDKYAEDIKRALVEHGRTEAAAEAMVAKKGGVFGFSKLMTKVLNYAREPEFTVETVTDTKTIEEDIDSRIDEAAYDKWLREMFRGLILDSGIHNGKDLYTAAGNRKSFKQTHYPVTLENVAKAMASQNDGNSKHVSGFVGIKSLRAGTAVRFKSIAHMHELEGRLKHLTQEEADAINDALGKRLSDITERIYNKKQHSKYTNTFIEYDTIGNILMEVTELDKYTVDSIQKVFSQYQYNLGNQLAADVRDLLFDVTQMPVNIFEAKPERAVRFDEVLAAVLPDNADASLRKQLEQMGLNVLTYRYGDEASRIEAVNSVDDAQFSLKEDANLMRENAKLKEVNQELREQFKTTQFAKVDKKALRDFTKDLLKDYSSGADIDETRDALDGLYTYLANGEDGMPTSWNEAHKRAYEVAVSVLENATTLDDEMWRQYKDLRDRLRNVGISISPEYGSDLMGYEDLQDFRRRNFGRLNIVKNGAPVDSLYAELANAYPELFDEHNYTNQGDQLVHIADVLEEMKPIEVNPYRHDMREAATWLANDIMERFFELPQAKPTFADKAEQKLTKQSIKDAKKLERLRTEKNEKIAKIIQENREKVRNVVTGERMAAGREIENLKRKQRERDAKKSQSQKAKEMRAKILRHTTELSKKLLRASDKNHIPQELQGVVAKLLESINMESNYTYDSQSDSYKRNDLGTPTMRSRLFSNLRKIYGELANELTIDPDLLGDDGLLAEVVGMADLKLADMTLNELETVWKAIRAIEASVMSANIAFNKARLATISEAAETLRMDNFGKKEKVELDGPGSALGKVQKLTGLDMMTPESYFHRLGKSGDNLFRMMRDAQDDHIRKMKEVSDFTHEALKGVNVRKLENQMHTVKLGEKDVQMSTAQIMELYVLMRREQARDHIMVGGILPDVVSKGGIKKVSRAKPVRGVQLGELAKAFKLLTDEQIQIAEKLQEYASTELSKWGNEAAMKVYNYEKFGEKTYWPIRVNQQETQSNVQKDTQVTSVAGRGFTKGTKPHANNSVMVGSIFDTFSTHASEMATYASWLATMEDINRIRNFTFKSEGTTVDTVKGIIDTVHGKAGTAYLSKLLADLSNGVKGTHGETNYMSGLVGNYKAASVGANLRVIIQQPTSLLRALDMLDPQYLVAGVRPENGWKKALKYAPIAQWKDWGYFDINTGRQMKDVLFDSDSKLNKVKNASMWGASKADSLSWGLLWNAVETETKHKRKDLKPDTEEFYQAVAERFNEIVDHTQVVDGILQRSQIMRSADGLTKMATSFMGEPTKQYNMMMSAAYDAVHGNRKAGKRRFMRSAVALLIAGVVNAMAQSIMDAVRDDDKEKDYWEKWLEALTGISGDEESLGEAAKNAILDGNLGSTFNPATYIPYVKDAVSIIQGYDVSRMDMESIEKTLTASQNMVKALNGEGKYTLPSAAASLFAEVARMAGIPVANLKREVKSFAMLSAIETDNYLMQYRMEKATLSLNYSGNSGTFLDILFNAYQNDREAYEIIYKDMIASGYDAEKLANGMESRMKKAQGVEKADELEQRYLTPVQQGSYDKSMAEIRDSGLWGMASTDQRDAVEEMLYNLAVDNSAGQKLQEKIDGGAEYGIDEEDYLLYKLALSIVDEPTESGKLGSYTQEEAAAAIEMLMLDDDASRYLWQSTNAGWKEKNNPWR